MRPLSFILFLFFYYPVFAQLKVPNIATCGRFGIACSIDGAPEESMIQTIYLANNLKRDSLLNWLKSSDPQNQIHGYIGLYFISQNGYHLSPEEKGLMKKIEQSEALVDYCEGCTILPKEKMVVLLSRKRLSGYYSWYSNFGWKKAFQ